MKLKYLKEDYVPKGQLEGFPLEIIDKMLERQVDQGNKLDVEVFEDSTSSLVSRGGFTWSDTEEYHDFWENVIAYKNFNLFFQKYPKELPLPRVIEVRDSETDLWAKRVVIAFKKNKAICWLFANTLEEAEKEVQTSDWNYWREVEDGLQEEDFDEGQAPDMDDEYQPFDFSNGVKDYSYLMDKIIVNKDIGRMFKVSELFYDDILKTSHINDFECEYLFNHCEFEDGSPVGIKL